MLTDLDEHRQLFEQCNSSELYQIAKNSGLVVAPNLTREALVDIVARQETLPGLAPHAFDAYRRAIIRFLVDHRKTLETQIVCPARVLYSPAAGTRTPDQAAEHDEQEKEACFGCVDAQVVHCITSNGEESLRLIQLYKKL